MPSRGTTDMYGFINTCLKSLVTEKFGEETWEKLSSLAGVQDTFMTYEVYDDDLTLRLVREACGMLDVSSEVVLKLFGEHFFSFCKRSGYDAMLRTLGGNLTEFIENLDALHSYLALSYQEMNAPSFRVEKNERDEMLLHYYSDRRGLYHIVPGIIKAVARDFFNSEVTMTVLNQSEEDERTGKKEHVVFLVTQDRRTAVQEDGRTAVQEDGEQEDKGVRERFAGDRPGGDLVRPGEVRPDGDPVWPGGDRVRPGGDRVRPGEVRPGGDPVRPGGDPVRPGGDRHCSFRPCYPDRLWLEEEAFCNAFPFHIVFDEDLKVKQTGVNIQKFVPGLQMKDIRLDQYFTIMHPQVTFTIDSIKKFINSQFVLKMQTETIPQHRHTALKLRGQMVWMPSLACMLYLSSPKLRSLQELQERGLHLADIAPHDTTRDLILLNQQRLAEMELSNQLERKKEELRVLSHHLAMEKQKTETLLYAMLPPHVANQLREGRRVEAAEFEVCTILFSDVVAFTSMCAACEPIRIVHMLNSMYSRFDRLTGVHGVYKVETIGDAYMVVGGVPVATASHAHRVANFALGMRLAAREVNNPVSGQPIQIRVGLHTGPVLAGVVGDKMPRYCLFGDTVNTASRMESQGVPDHIHLSPDTYTVLRGQGFDLQERGEIEVKGKGLMTTYFLYGNLLACEAAIMGRDGADSSSSSSLYTEKQPAQRRSPEPVSVHVTTKETCDWSPPASRKSSLDSLEGDAAEAVPAVPPYEWDITPPYRRDRGHSGSGDAIVHTRFCHLL